MAHRTPAHRTSALGPVLALGATAVAAACAVAVPAAELSAAVAGHLQGAGIPADAVTCPEQLDGEVGASVTCTFTVHGQPVDAVVSVSAVAGDRASYAVTTRARAVPQEVLEQRLAADVAERSRFATPDVDCPGELPPTVGASLLCGLGDGQRAARVSVTRVDGGLVEYSVVVT